MSSKKACCTKEGLNRGAWTSEEDKLLSDYIKTHGPGNWRSVPTKAGLKRCGKSCRLRWLNYLRPDIKRGNISEAEEDLIIRLHKLLGNRWSLIAGRLPGRTDNEIKNYWNTYLKKKAAGVINTPYDAFKSKRGLSNNVIRTTAARCTKPLFVDQNQVYSNDNSTDASTTPTSLGGEFLPEFEEINDLATHHSSLDAMEFFMPEFDQYSQLYQEPKDFPSTSNCELLQQSTVADDCLGGMADDGEFLDSGLWESLFLP